MMKRAMPLVCLTTYLVLAGAEAQAQESKPAVGAAAQAKATQVAPPPQYSVRLPQPGKVVVLPKGKQVTVNGMTLKGNAPVKEDSVVTQ